MTGVVDDDLLGGLAALGAERLDLLDDLHALNDLSENDVLAVQPRALDGGQEELRTVSVWAGVGHRQHAWLSVTKLKVISSAYPCDESEQYKIKNTQSLTFIHN